MAQVVKTKQWLDLSDRYFVLLGAASAMGPVLVLLALGANVIACDLKVRLGKDGKAMTFRGSDKVNYGPWKGPLIDGRDGLFKACEESCGTLTFPIPTGRKQSAIPADELWK